MVPQNARTGRSPGSNQTGMPRVSPWLLQFFYKVAQRRIAFSFRGLRIAHECRSQVPAGAPVVVVLNHPSWWDPLVGFVLARRLFPSRRFYAPMDEDALRRYGIFRRLGMFAVAPHSPRGAVQFLRTGARILDRGESLAVTPQGQFTDARLRPVVFQSGVAALLQRRSAQGKATAVLPIALEYTFWDQRQPEVLVNCGELLRFGGESGVPAQQEIHAELEQAMTRTQDELAELSYRRDPGNFSTVLEGRSGSAGFYGWIERFRSLLPGKRQRGDHTSASTAAHNVTSPSKR